jgi:ethanolaminephosphotransferase
VTFCPQWLAPNLITLLGFVAILVNIVSIAVLVPDFAGPGPTWMYWSFVLGLWIYSTLDNIDGKQARRTGFPQRLEKGELIEGTSSPLGELFDHGTQKGSGRD